MGLIEQITQWKSQGYSEEAIINGLREQGVSPKEINDTFNQIKIKNAVAQDSSEGSYIPSQEYSTSQEPPQPQEGYSQSYYPQQNNQENYNYSQTEQAYSQGYQNYGDYYQGGTTSMMEVAEHIFAEKNKEIQKEINSLKEFKKLSENKINNISERIKKIEDTLTSLQSAILQKVGSYGEDLQTVKKEISMIEDSFKKMTGNIADKISKKKS